MQNLTEVTTRLTIIKYYDGNTNEVHSVEVVGKLNITECKTYLKENVLDNAVFITKEDKKETFLVDTIALIGLRIETTL